MQLRKKNIIICSMIILLFIVGYAYNNFTSGKLVDTSLELDTNTINNDNVAVTDEQNQTSKDEQNQTSTESKKAEQKGNLAVIPDTNENTIETTSSSFFSEYRLERDKNRSKEVEMWQDIINNDKAEETFKNLAQQELMKIVALTEKEMIIENLIISRGFNDALVFLTDDSATVIVDAKELSPSNVAQIQDIVVRKTKLDPKNIKIMRKN
ncbi:MAG: SpoIIIAH-like family protein [Caulobacteraceae bacterium]